MGLLKLTQNTMLLCLLVLHLASKPLEQDLLLFGLPGSLPLALFQQIIRLFDLLFILMSLLSDLFVELGLGVLQGPLVMLSHLFDLLILLDPHVFDMQIVLNLNVPQGFRMFPLHAVRDVLQVSVALHANLELRAHFLQYELVLIDYVY